MTTIYEAELVRVWYDLPIITIRPCRRHHHRVDRCVAAVGLLISKECGTLDQHRPRPHPPQSANQLINKQF